MAGTESGVTFWNALAAALPTFIGEVDPENNAAAPPPPSHAEELALSQLMVLLHTYQLAEGQAATLGGVCGLAAGCSLRNT